MKTRFDTEEENKKETKQQPLLPDHPFKKPAVPTPFDKISLVNKYVISPILELEDLHLMGASQKLYGFYQKTARLKSILHHVAYGEYKNAKAIIEKNPQLLLQKGTVKIQHTGLTFKDKTALQVALYLKDTEMVKLFQSHMDLENIQTQQNAQLPQGYEAKDAEKIKVGHKILEETFKAILDAKVVVDNQGNIIPDEKAKSAINCLRDYLNAAETVTGQDITDALLQKEFELYDANFDRFSLHTPAGDLATTSPKNMLAWRQIMGLIQFYLSLKNIQALSDGLNITIKKKEAGKLQGRNLEFHIWNGNGWSESNFLSLVSRPSAGLGFDYGFHYGCGGGGAQTSSGPRGEYVVRQGFLSKLMSLEQQALQNLCFTQHTVCTEKRKRFGE